MKPRRVRIKVESGPAGLTAGRNGQIEWDVPAGLAEQTVTVILAVTDSDSRCSRRRGPSSRDEIDADRKKRLDHTWREIDALLAEAERAAEHPKGLEGVAADYFAPYDGLKPRQRRIVHAYLAYLQESAEAELGRGE